MNTPATSSQRRLVRPQAVDFRQGPPRAQRERGTDHLLVYQSFGVLDDYKSLSFEELRLRDTQPPTPAVLHQPQKFGTVGNLGRLVLRDFYFKNRTAHMRHDVHDMLSIVPPIVTVRVGNDLEEITDFSVHENILTHCSPYFRTALKSDWRPDSNVIPLEANPTAFKIYVEWMYSGRICTYQPPDQHPNEDTGFENLAQAWILGDIVLDPRFKNLVINAFLDKFVQEGRLDLSLPGLIYENTMPGALLRRLLVDLYSWYGSPYWVQGEVGVTHHNDEFMRDLVGRAMGDRPRYAVRWPVMCRYHEHKDGERCSDGALCYSPPRAMGKETE